MIKKAKIIMISIVSILILGAGVGVVIYLKPWNKDPHDNNPGRKYKSFSVTKQDDFKPMSSKSKILINSVLKIPEDIFKKNDIKFTGEIDLNFIKNKTTKAKFIFDSKVNLTKEQNHILDTKNFNKLFPSEERKDIYISVNVERDESTDKKDNTISKVIELSCGTKTIGNDSISEFYGFSIPTINFVIKY